MPRASEATPWVTDCHSIDALKGQKHSMLEIDIKLLPLQGATAPTRDTQGVASLALGYVLHWAFIDIIGCGSAIQASLIAFALHDDSARPC